MSDYRQTRDAAGKVTAQYGQMLRNLDDDLAVIGVDGIRRSFDEHYDTIREVEQDPTGAMWAIHKQADRIEELEVKLATCRKYRDAYAECDRISTHALRKAVRALDEAVYLLVPDEEDMAKKAGVYRIVTTLAELKGETDG